MIKIAYDCVKTYYYRSKTASMLFAQAHGTAAWKPVTHEATPMGRNPTLN